MEAIKQLIGQVMTFCRLEKAMCDKLEDHDRRLYALEENRRLKDQSILDMKQEIQQLKTLLRQKVTV